MISNMYSLAPTDSIHAEFKLHDILILSCKQRFIMTQLKRILSYFFFIFIIICVIIGSIESFCHIGNQSDSVTFHVNHSPLLTISTVIK